MKRISILGSTGSVGRGVLDVISRSQGAYGVVGLAAGQNVRLLVEQIRTFRPRIVAVMSQDLADEVRSLCGASAPEVLFGKEGYTAVASMEEAHMVVSAMVGAAGLVPTLAAIEAGKAVALANKETLVAAGPFVMERARKKGVTILPVDSEHSAIFQCLAGNRASDVSRILLTASGGPFREKGRFDLERVTPEEAIRHPNWTMGAKITVDSATLMNKGLELIEASHLFHIPVDRIEILVHPESIVHSLVEFRDGSVMAQLGVPDMRIPIACALSWPERMDLPAVPRLDLVSVGRLTFEPPDRERFPCLGLAYRAAQVGGTATTALNAANEVAVEAFLHKRIGFTAIARVVEDVLDGFPVEAIDDLDTVLRADALARLRAEHVVHTMENTLI
ncbi:MAG: 1-deoxy-D-xylulose-5-phosphate reductoisomerase [Deltaproteobacteria bacterium]